MDAAALLLTVAHLPSSQVYAGRRGICGGAHRQFQAFVFRRTEDGRLWFERWGTSGTRYEPTVKEPVSAELLKRVGDWLDSL